MKMTNKPRIIRHSLISHCNMAIYMTPALQYITTVKIEILCVIHNSGSKKIIHYSSIINNLRDLHLNGRLSWPSKLVHQLN